VVAPLAAVAACASDIRSADLLPVQLDATQNESTEMKQAAFKVEGPTDDGTFHGHLRNDEGLFTVALYQRFLQFAQTHCGAKQAVVGDGDLVLITTHQRQPDPSLQADFRCEASK
jgi:hypothetical protein